MLELGSKRLLENALEVASRGFDLLEPVVPGLCGLLEAEKAGCIILSKYTENSCPFGAGLVFAVAAFVPPNASLAPFGVMEGSEFKEFMLIVCTLVVFCKVFYRQKWFISVGVFF